MHDFVEAVFVDACVGLIEAVLVPAVGVELHPIHFFEVVGELEVVPMRVGVCLVEIVEVYLLGVFDGDEVRTQHVAFLWDADAFLKRWVLACVAGIGDDGDDAED